MENTIEATPPVRQNSGGFAIVCPHCQTQGHVTSKQVKVKKGISGGKLTAAVLTVGFSLLVTGLSRKQTVTQLKCSNCGMTWQVG